MELNLECYKEQDTRELKKKSPQKSFSFNLVLPPQCTQMVNILVPPHCLALLRPENEDFAFDVQYYVIYL